MTSDDMNTSGEKQSTITEGALETFTLRLVLAQLRHDVDHLSIVLRDIRVGPSFLWGVAVLLSAVAADSAAALCGDDRQAAARKVALAYRQGVYLGDAWRLVLVQLTDADAVGDVLEDIENQGGLDLVERVVCFLNGVVAQWFVQQCGGNRKAAARNVEAQLAEALSRPTE